MKNKKIIIIICSIIVLFGLVFAAIKLTSTGSGNLVKTNKGNVKIVASKVSKIEFEDYENDEKAKRVGSYLWWRWNVLYNKCL